MLSDDVTHNSGTTFEKLIPVAVAQRLLESVMAIGNHHVELTDRRRAFLTVLLEEIGADAGFWRLLNY